jgi:actin
MIINSFFFSPQILTRNHYNSEFIRCKKMTQTPIVIDNGTGSIKAGLAGFDAPTQVFNSVFGEPRESTALKKVATDQKMSSYVGQEAEEKRSILTLKYPVQKGMITDWDCMEKMWNYTFYNKLKISPSEHSVLLSQAPLTQEIDREKMCEIMFEVFDTPAMFIALQPVLSTYASGRTTSLIVDCGYSLTRVVPVYEGYVINKAIISLDVAGEQCTDFLQKLISARTSRSQTQRN